MERIILHSDLNNFFASVEAVINPEYAGGDKFIAVCGLEEDRHGIVLAKNENAKRMGVKTGDTIWQARQKCPGIIIAQPHFDKYSYYSKLVRKIYSDYTDEVEAFGMDECWLDVTHSTSLFGDGKNIAETIRKRVKRETGLTVSVGVSFNKVFAKLCSDMKKPDAVTVVNRADFREKIWWLPAENMLGVGRSTLRTLKRHGIFTIGDIARTPSAYLEKWLGKCGYQLYSFANGLDDSPVLPIEYTAAPKSISRGVTCRENLENDDEVSKILLYLAGDVSSKLREHCMLASSVTISVRDCSLYTSEYSMRLVSPSRSRAVIFEATYALFKSSYNWSAAGRAITVRASGLSCDGEPTVMDFFTDTIHAEKLERKEATVDLICKHFGKDSVIPASLLGDIKLPHIINEATLPPAVRAGS